MTDLHFPVYSYTSFYDHELKYEAPESKGELIRYDYFDLTKINYVDKRNFLKELFDEYYDIINNKGVEYKDYLIHRYFFKDFVIRETTDDGKETRFYKYSLSDWSKANKDRGYDDRVLTVNCYTELKDGYFYRDLSFKIKVGHRYAAANYINSLTAKYEKNHKGITKENLYILPLYFTVDSIDNLNLSGSYIRASEAKNWYDNTVYDIFILIPQSIYRFSLLNMYMLNKTEENESINFIEDDGIVVSNDIISYIKTRATEDKKIIIDMGKEMKLRINPKRQNIYSHNNHSVRTLCDYKFQVSAHWHHYWIGSRKNNTQERICKWVEAYYKNPKKEFRIIKERVNMA